MFNKLLVKTFMATALSALFAAAPLSAATFTFTGEVTTTIGPSAVLGTPSLPPSGTEGTVELLINDTDSSLTIFDDFNVREFATVSLDVPGWISGSMTNNPDPFDYFDISATSFAFGSYGPTSVATDNGAFILPQAFHSFRVNFGASVAATPNSIGDLVTALSVPGASGFFSHELEVGGSGFIHTRVEFPASPVPSIPLPASAWLLLVGLGTFRLVRDKKVQSSA